MGGRFGLGCIDYQSSAGGEGANGRGYCTIGRLYSWTKF